MALQFPQAGIREIRSLMRLKHPNIVDLRGVAVGNKDEVLLVFEYCDNDIHTMMKHRSEAFSMPEVKCIVIQLLRAVEYVHAHGFLHRDIKMSNLLYRNGNVKLADFGLARESVPGNARYSSRVVTLWFRPPELLLGSSTYGTSLDMWSVGCVVAELMLGRPVFPASSEPEALVFIARLLGPPTPARFPEIVHLPEPVPQAVAEGEAAVRRALAIGYGKTGQFPSPATARGPPDAFEAVFPRLSPAGLDFLRRLLSYSPEKRMSASEALAHPFLTSEHPHPSEPEDMPFCRDQIAIDTEAAAGPGNAPRVAVRAAGPAADPEELHGGHAAALIGTSALSYSMPETVSRLVDGALAEWRSVTSSFVGLPPASDTAPSLPVSSALTALLGPSSDAVRGLPGAVASAQQGRAHSARPVLAGRPWPRPTAPRLPPGRPDQPVQPEQPAQRRPWQSAPLPASGIAGFGPPFPHVPPTTDRPAPQWRPVMAPNGPAPQLRPEAAAAMGALPASSAWQSLANRGPAHLPCPSSSWSGASRGTPSFVPGLGSRPDDDREHVHRRHPSEHAHREHRRDYDDNHHRHHHHHHHHLHHHSDRHDARGGDYHRHDGPHRHDDHRGHHPHNGAHFRGFDDGHGRGGATLRYGRDGHEARDRGHAVAYQSGDHPGGGVERRSDVRHRDTSRDADRRGASLGDSRPYYGTDRPSARW